MARAMGPVSSNWTGRAGCESSVSEIARAEKRNGRHGMSRSRAMRQAGLYVQDLDHIDQLNAPSTNLSIFKMMKLVSIFMRWLICHMGSLGRTEEEDGVAGCVAPDGFAPGGVNAGAGGTGLDGVAGPGLGAFLAASLAAAMADCSSMY